MPKRVHLLTAYVWLATATGCVLAYDAYCRHALAMRPPHSHGPAPSVADNPLPITPLAESPFLRPRTHRQPPPPLAETQSAPGAGAFGKRRLVQAGVYYLNVSVKTAIDEGSKSFGPGTPVRVLRRQDGKVKVSHDGSDFLVEEWQITSDPEAERTLARSTP